MRAFQSVVPSFTRFVKVWRIYTFGLKWDYNKSDYFWQQKFLKRLS